MKKSRYTDSQILAILKQNEAGISVADDLSPELVPVSKREIIMPQLSQTHSVVDNSASCAV